MASNSKRTTNLRPFDMSGPNPPRQNPPQPPRRKPKRKLGGVSDLHIEMMEGMTDEEIDAMTDPREP